MKLAVLAAVSALVPGPVVNAVHGRIVGWGRTGPDWFAVYLDRKGGGWCGLEGATWHLALVASRPLPEHVVADRRIQQAMCGNTLAWLRAGRFSDGRHREVASMLWTTPSIGATTRIYRIDGRRLRLLASFAGDRVVLTRGKAVATFENAGRNPRGTRENVYRFRNGRYRLVG